MQENQSTTKMLMVPLRGVSVYPNMLIHLDVGREASIQAFQQAMERDEPIYLVTQRNQAEDPEMEDLFPMGTHLQRAPGDPPARAACFACWRRETAAASTWPLSWRMAVAMPR